MLTYIVKRLFLLVPTLLGIVTIAFLLGHSTDVSPAINILGQKATPEAVAALEKENGWDRPLAEQYFRYCGRVLKGDFGMAYVGSKRPVAVDLARYFPATIELSLVALMLAVLVGVPVGIISAAKPNSIFDYVGMGIAMLGVSLPVFFLGYVLIAIFGDILPYTHRLSTTVLVTTTFEERTHFLIVDTLLSGNFRLFFDYLTHLILPAVALATIPMAVIARMTRSSMLEVLGEDYIRTARAKGLSEKKVLIKHAFRNALIPIVTITGIQVGYLLAGAVLTETVFSWPGIGSYVVNAAIDRDFNALQGALILIASTFVAVNLVVDLSYNLIDPRVALESGR